MKIEITDFTKHALSVSVIALKEYAVSIKMCKEWGQGSTVSEILERNHETVLQYMDVIEGMLRRIKEQESQ